MMKLLAVFFVLSLGLVAPEVSSNELDEEYNKLGDIWSNCGKRSKKDDAIPAIAMHA